MTVEIDPNELEHTGGTQVPESSESDSEGHTEPVGGTPEGEQPTVLQKLKDEAASNRIAAREAKQELEALQADYRALMITHHTQGILTDPADLAWSDDLTDGESIRAAAQALVAERPHLGRVRGSVGQGEHSQQAAMSLSEALRAMAGA